MAGDWIKMRSELQSHPKVVRILSATQSDKFRVIGGLHAVWSVFDTHTTTGAMVGYTPDLMDHVIGWPGFSAAMLAVNWLLFDGEQTLALPEFDEHNSQGAKRRAEDQKRKRNVRRDEENNPPKSGQIADKKWTREREDKREETSTASLSHSAGADEGGLLVTDGNGVPSTKLDGAQSIGVGVPAAKRLRDIGIRVTALDPTLLALCAEKFTVEEMALMASEQVLRKAHLWNDAEVHPELPELLASAATQQQMLLTPTQYTSIQAAAAGIGINYIAEALRGRRQDAIDKQSPSRAPKSGAKRPSATDNFEGKNYVGTAIDKLSPELRAGFERGAGNSG